MLVEKLANWEKLKMLVLDSVSSPITKRSVSGHQRIFHDHIFAPLTFRTARPFR
jgi:hypothetical protein